MMGKYQVMMDHRDSCRRLTQPESHADDSTYNGHQQEEHACKKIPPASKGVAG
ncbi:hypothetical protein [Acidithiobacillus thiooxidans]|uniref:hypothetical protein n=1 Tax=Acidithiobacillus thiooxidans TaxID=930 RepID=UPI0012D36081|nr:hypothetical protein [Acidithiobacillus thiooxidans]